jgi:chromosome partitioning protein
MKIIVIASQKGGAGKTTLAVHMAVTAAMGGFRVGLIDLDPQASATKWGRRRLRAGHAPEIAVTATTAELLGGVVDGARASGADLLLIDTAPSADRASLVAARLADFLLIPVRPATFDLEAIEATRDVAELARRPAAVVINAAPVRSNIVTEASDGLAAAGATMAPIIIHQRVAFSHPIGNGGTAMNYEPGGKAECEVSALTLWACGQAGLLPCGHAGIPA